MGKKKLRCDRYEHWLSINNYYSFKIEKDLILLIYYEKIKIKEKVDVNSEANENVIVNHSNDNNNDKFEDSNISDWNSNLNEKEGNMTEYEKDSQNNDCATPPIKSNNFFLNVYKTESIYQIFQHRVLLMMMIL